MSEFVYNALVIILVCVVLFEGAVAIFLIARAMNRAAARMTDYSPEAEEEFEPGTSL